MSLRSASPGLGLYLFAALAFTSIHISTLAAAEILERPCVKILAPDESERVKFKDIVVGILSDDLGRILIGERMTPQDWQGLWELPGGKVEAGESQRAALEREFKEELGVEVIADEKPTFDQWQSFSGKNLHVIFFRVRPRADNYLLPPRVHANLAWIGPRTPRTRPLLVNYDQLFGLLWPK